MGEFLTAFLQNPPGPYVLWRGAMDCLPASKSFWKRRYLRSGSKTPESQNTLDLAHPVVYTLCRRQIG